VKGGHIPGDEVLDVLVTENDIEVARHPRIDTDATHGSGCALSAAVATRLAHGEPLVDAVGRSVAFMERAVRYHHDVGEGAGAVHHLVALRNEAARDATAEAVRGVVRRLEGADVRPLVPEVGTNVVGTTPYAESADETAAVEGRITRGLDGVRADGVRFGASGHVARFLLSAREHRPDLRFAANCRFDDGVEAALEALGWPITEHGGGAAADDATDGLGAALAGAEKPVAVVDHDASTAPMTKVVAESATTLGDRLLELNEAVGSRR